MDKLVRKIVDKTTNLPITGATVKARPKDVGAVGDVDMPETSAGSGVYATTAEVAHNTYGIIVDGQDSLDEATVEPGRVGVTKFDGSKAYPLIDRVLDSKLVLRSFIADGADTVASADLIAAIAAATGAKPRTLVFDADATLDSSVDVTDGDLVVDLNGYTITLSNSNSKITSSSRRLRFFNGKIHVATVNSIIQGVGTNFVAIQFSGATTAFARPDGTMTFDGCDGLNALPGASASGQTSSVGGGSHGFGLASQLKLTDPGSNSGAGRLVKLQNLVDTWYDNIVGYINDACTWLTADKRSKLDVWTSMTDEARASVANAAASFQGNVSWRGFQSETMYNDVTNDFEPTRWRGLEIHARIAEAGIATGCKITTTASGVFSSARIVGLSVASANGQTKHLIGENDSQMEEVFDFCNGALINGLKPVSIKVWKIVDSGGTAGLVPLRMDTSGTVKSLSRIMKITANDEIAIMLFVENVIGYNGATVASGDYLLFDITISDESIGAFEPVSAGA